MRKFTYLILLTLSLTNSFGITNSPLKKTLHQIPTKIDDYKYNSKQLTSPYTNFELTISNNENNRSTQIFYIDEKTTGFDNGYDSKMFGGTTVTFAVYTKLVSDINDSRDLSIQTLPNENYENMIIPVGILATTNEEYSLSIVPENFPENLTIYLEDQANNTFTNLTEENYTFTHNNTSLGRFYIHTTYNLPYSYTWTGTTNNEWNLASNWLEAAIPPSNANITIPNAANNYPTLSASLTVSSLTMNSSTTLISNGFDITGIITYKNSLPPNWHLISAPINGETIANLTNNNNFAIGTNDNIGIGFYDNNETSPWRYQTNTSIENLNNGVGIAVKLSTADNIYFQGTLNNTDINYTISKGTRDNFNLIGNPFTAYINSTTFINTNETVLSEKTIWFWNGTEYVTYNYQNQIEIAPIQGFFVEAGFSGDITFKTSNQSHQSTNTFMKPKTSTSFELIIENQNAKSATKIYYTEGTTAGFDNGYDSKMFEATTYDFAVFTQLVSDNKGDNLAIQTLPIDNNIAIPVGITANAGEEVTFSIESFNLPYNTTVYLENRTSNELVNLSETTYKTTLESNANGIGQFYIHTSAKSLSTEDITNNLDNVSIYKSSNTQVTIAGLNADASVSIFSLLGKQIVNTNISANTVNKISLPTLSTGVYIINVNSKLGKVTKKITLE